ncbi:MAG: aminotransferase class III-fold pyridoxal phosphate-dependent enzyme [Actinobacteria bacterium]|nr:aminotransferase class III-fold pyridoxal phosphate-dependent enzyme [Actinomycetota bacterium]MBS1882804.1 aminotransferase class III-fold pyridoxal phosphate-dependent enzyme [Actinomycetota bacterium]
MRTNYDTTTPAAELDRRTVFHPFTALARHEREGPLMIVAGEGCRLRDDHGREYIDAMAGLWCVNVGYGRPEIAEALREQALRLPYYHSFSSMATEPPARLADRLLSVAPGSMSKVFFGNSGSDANDTQVKLVRYYNNALGRPQKKKVIARRRGYHGVTLTAASLTGLDSLHRGFDLPQPGIVHTTAPSRLWEAEPGIDDEEFSRRLAHDLEQLILAEGPDTVAAFIAEPVQGAGGVLVPPAGYFAAIQEVLRRHDVLLIADEVITGFGRLGAWSGSELLGIEPDLITYAKGMTSGYVPLSACVVSEAVWRALVEGGHDEAFGHGYTYSSHPLAAAAALANLDLIDAEDLIGRVGVVGPHLQARLREAFAGHPLVGEVRGTGLIAAVELVAATDPPRRFDPALRVGPRVAAACLRRGVITRALPEADTLSLSPPFVITEAEVDECVAALRDAVDEVAGELVGEGQDV